MLGLFILYEACGISQFWREQGFQIPKEAQVLKNLELSPVFIVLSSQQTDGQAERKRQVDFHGLHVDTEDLLVRPAQG